MNTRFSVSPGNLRHQKRLACGLIPVLNMLSDLDADVEGVLSSVGVRKVELIDPAFTISFDDELLIIEKALDYFTEPAASLKLAGYYHLHNFSVLGLAIRSCSTLGEMFELILRYPRLVWGICETTNAIEGDVIDFGLLAGETRPERFLLERDMACVKTMCGEALNDELELIEVRFSHSATADVACYEEFFNCPVRFDQSTSGLKFSLGQLERAVPSADPLSREFYEAQCARLQAEIDQPFLYATMIRDHLLYLTPIPSLEDLAENLGMEPRTLQRALKKENTTFSDILRDVRFRRARDRLRFSDNSMEQIAMELGFNDAVAFSHAFKQWSGESPRNWLKHNRTS